ncbi:MAG TPA: hypothetical protein VHC45_02020 [Gaiellaceae bacterium]|jgi:hypothetical protein|nr:hypothetical protein [Gaiellaceae bacterium]
MTQTPIHRTSHRNGEGAIVEGAQFWSFREPGLDADVIDAYTTEIRESLNAGEIEAAYARFNDWLVREARYAKAGRTTNMPELTATMLELLGWMYERVPRTIVRSVASV